METVGMGEADPIHAKQEALARWNVEGVRRQEAEFLND